MSFQPTDPHATDEQLSAGIDRRLEGDEATRVRAHLSLCEQCADRAAEFQMVAHLLAALPQVDVPREFAPTPTLSRLVALPDPPNVSRLRQWYIATRVGAASLAAGCVLLSAATLYVDSVPAPGAANSVAPMAADAAPNTQAANTPRPAARAIAPPAGQSAAAPAPQNLAAPGRTAPDGDPADLQAAATNVSPLRPTPMPTAMATAPTRPAVPAGAAPGAPRADVGAPWRLAAIGCGLLTALALFAALALRQRLLALAHHPVAE